MARGDNLQDGNYSVFTGSFRRHEYQPNQIGLDFDRFGFDKFGFSIGSVLIG